ncbi:MAG: MopE-related protein [Sandaracinaceae bacterium]
MSLHARSPLRRNPLAVLLCATTMLGGCGNQYDLNVAFDPPELADDASRIELSVIPRCGDQALGADAVGALASSTLTRDGEAMAVGALPAGSYGLYGRAVGGDCDIVATGCIPIEVEAGGSGRFTVVLDRFSGTTCPVGQCSDGVCVPGGDAGPMDAGPMDAGRDAGSPDGGCSEDCDDSDPCTDDACMAGACSYTTRDADDDGSGDAMCPEVGGVPNDDCDDTDPLVAPSLAERCNGVDDDCDDATDEDFDCALGDTEACPACGPGERVCEDSCTFGACVPATDGDTVALWAFEEAAGAAFADTTGSHDGTMVGTGGRVDGPAFCGQALDMDGTAFGVVSNSTDFDLDVGSVSMWVRFETPDVLQAALSRDELNINTDGHINIRRLPSGLLEARIQAVGSPSFSCMTTELVALDVWHEVVVRWGPPDFEMVVDGVPFTTCGAAPWTTGIAGNTNPIAFGGNQMETAPGLATDSADLLNGSLDHVELRSGRAAAASPEITTVVLVDADADVDLGPMYDGMVLDLATLPANMNFRATVDPGMPGSVSVELDGTAGTAQAIPPYSFEDSDGDYDPVPLSVGAHVLEVTAYTEAALMGTAGPTRTINFTVR